MPTLNPTRNYQRMRNVIRMFHEIFLVSRLLPLRQFFRWCACLLKSLPEVLALKSLGPVDRKFGDIFSVKADRRLLHFENVSGGSFGVMREIFGHECYVKLTELRNAKHILDFGSNCGAFTLFALIHAPQAQIYAVEAQKELVEISKANIRRNGFESRAEVETALVGGNCSAWTEKLCQSEPTLGVFAIHDYLEKVGTCDFLKCDVEGAEYVLFSGNLDWLDRVKFMALEYHGELDQITKLRATLESKNFQVRQQDHGRFGYFYCTRSI